MPAIADTLWSMLRSVWANRIRILVRDLTGRDRRLLFRAWWLLHITRIGFRLAGFQRMHDLLARRPAPRSATIEEARHIASLVSLAAKYSIGRPNCLARSTAALALLRKHGIPADVRFGVKKEEGAILFHAWVEVDGSVVNDDDDVATLYAPFAGPVEGKRFD